MGEKNYQGLFNFDGQATLAESFPLAFQHVIAMIAGCITPPLDFVRGGWLKSPRYDYTYTNVTNRFSLNFTFNDLSI